MIFVVAETGDFIGRLRSKKEVAAAFFPNAAGESEFSPRAQCEDGLSPALNCGILRPQCAGPSQIVFGVLVGAAHFGVIGQRSQLLQRPVHVTCCSFEQASTSTGKECVAAEQHRTESPIHSRIHHKRNVMSGVSSYSQHFKAVIHEPDAVAIANGHGLEGNAFPIGGTGHHSRFRPDFQQTRSSPDVIGMVMGLQNRHKLQLPFLQPGRDRCALRWIHHNSVMTPHQDPDDVVLQHRKRMQCGSHR